MPKSDIFTFIHIFAFRIVSSSYRKNMEFLTIFNLFLLICVFGGLSAKDPPLPTDFKWTHGGFWKLVGSHLFAKNHPISSMQFEDLSGNETVEESNAPSPSKEDCYSSDESTNFEDCKYLVEDMLDANRLPQVISTVTCLQRGGNVSSKKLRFHRHTKCEEVTLEIPVLKKKSGGEGRGNYAVAFETTSVACVRTVRRSRIRSTSAHRIILDVPS